MTRTADPQKATAAARANGNGHKDDADVTHLGAYAVEQAALDAHDAGLCVIRAATDGTKKPLGEWKRWQTEMPSRDQITEWFGDGHTGMGLVTGKISGGLELLEFEGAAKTSGLITRWKAAIHDAGLDADWDRIRKGYQEATPGDGFHVLWRCEDIAGNQKLARRLDPETGETQVLIETRGEGGFVITAPSWGGTHPTGRPWVRRYGSFATVATIHPELRERILDIARSFDELPDAEPERIKPLGEQGDGGTLPGFDLTHEDILYDAGFTWHHTDRTGNAHWTRPGKDPREGSSLTVWADDHRATPWSTSINMPGEFLGGNRLLTPWQLHVALNHQGDFQTAAREWRRQHGPLVGTLELPEMPADLWQSRPALTHIHQAALSRRCSPTALLHVTLARLSAFIPHTLRLPAIVRSAVPLCYFAVLYGDTGGGKSSTNDVGRELLHPPDWALDQLPIGSGEGLAEVLIGIVKERDDNGDEQKVRKQVHHNAYVFVDEGQALMAAGRRKGSTVLPTVRTIWTGGVLGQTNANHDRYRYIPALSYAYGFVVGFQSTTVGELLDEVAAGTPGRFGWASVHNPQAPDDKPEWPGPLTVEWPFKAISGETMSVAAPVAAEVDANHLERHRGECEVDSLDAHGDLLRLKIAGLLAILDGRKDITKDDWHLSGTIKGDSDAVRGAVSASVAASRASQEAAASQRYARRQVEADAAVERRRIVDSARKIAEKVRAEPGEWSPAALRRSRQSWRDIFHDALDHAIAEGWIEERNEPGQGSDKRALHPGENRD